MRTPNRRSVENCIFYRIARTWWLEVRWRICNNDVVCIRQTLEILRKFICWHSFFFQPFKKWLTAAVKSCFWVNFWFKLKSCTVYTKTCIKRGPKNCPKFSWPTQPDRDTRTIMKLAICVRINSTYPQEVFLTMLSLVFSCACLRPIEQCNSCFKWTTYRTRWS